MSTPQDLVARLLQDAESAGRRGQRQLALDLLVTAMDIAPGDPSVAMRAQQAVIELKSTTSGAQEKKARAPLPAPRVRSPFTTSMPLPGSDGVAAALPIADAITTSTPFGATERPEVSVPGKSRRSSMRTAALGVLWVLGLLAALVLAVVGMRPELIDEARGWFGDPMVRAERAYDAGQLREAMAYAGRVRGEHESRATLLMGQIGLDVGDLGAARDHANAVLTADQAWATADRASSILLAAGDTASAAVAARLAFERGAPAERWLDITLTQIRAGNFEVAGNYLTLAARSPVYASGAGLRRLNAIRDSLLSRRP